jgi:hypothetical protein
MQTDNSLTTERKTLYNNTYPKGEVSCFEDTFVQAESSVLRIKFSAKNPTLRVAANL